MKGVALLLGTNGQLGHDILRAHAAARVATFVETMIPAARLRYSVLDPAKVSVPHSRPLPPWQDALERYLCARGAIGKYRGGIQRTTARAYDQSVQLTNLKPDDEATIYASADRPPADNTPSSIYRGSSSSSLQEVSGTYQKQA